MAEKVGVHAKIPGSKQKCSNSYKQNPSYNSSGSPADKILQLQRTAGNQAVQRLIKSRALQAKLKISQPNDIYEQEADRVAEQVMRMPEPTPQRKCAECDKDEKKVLRAKESSGRVLETQEQETPPIFHEVLSSPGKPLDQAARAFMEPRFGYDFSRVRVHSGAAAEQSARDVNANAYTVGHNVVFGAGQFAPGTRGGRRLLAHELAHVVQQSRGGKETISPLQSNLLEQNAQTAVSAITDSISWIGISGSSTPRIARAPGPGGGNVPKLRHHGLDASEIKLLNEVRSRLVPANERSTAIVGVLITEDGRQFEFKSGGGQGFSSHVEGKATAKMEELGITKATLLVEKEPCQICDRSVYPKETGPETPLKSSRTGKPLSRQTPKINTALIVGSELTVVDPESASIYRGVKPASTLGVPGSGGTGKKAEKGIFKGGKSAKPKTGTSKKAGLAPKTGTTDPGITPRTKAVPKAGTVTGGTGAAAKEAVSEARLAARAAAKELSADFKILRVAKGLTTAIHIIGFIAAIQTLDSFTQMTSKSLAGKGFILTKEIAEAENLEKEASTLKKDYFPFSEKLNEKQVRFFQAAVDPLSAGQLASSLSDINTNLDTLKLDLPKQIARVNAALKEAEAKQKAAEAILNDPKASAAIAMATFGTAELAQLFAASQDMARIASALRSASTDLTKVKIQVDEDFIFIHSWFEALFEVCRKGGQCSLTTIEIPFVGTSRIHRLPGEAE